MKRIFFVGLITMSGLTVNAATIGDACTEDSAVTLCDDTNEHLLIYCNIAEGETNGAYASAFTSEGVDCRLQGEDNPEGVAMTCGTYTCIDIPANADIVAAGYTDTADFCTQDSGVTCVGDTDGFCTSAESLFIGSPEGADDYPNYLCGGGQACIASRTDEGFASECQAPTAPCTEVSAAVGISGTIASACVYGRDSDEYTDPDTDENPWADDDVRQDDVDFVIDQRIGLDCGSINYTESLEEGVDFTVTASAVTGADGGFCEVSEGGMCDGFMTKCGAGFTCDFSRFYVSDIIFREELAANPEASPFYIQAGVCVPEPAAAASCNPDTFQVGCVPESNIFAYNCDADGRTYGIDCGATGGQCLTYCEAEQDGFCIPEGDPSDLSFLFGCLPGHTCNPDTFTCESFLNNDNGGDAGNVGNTGNTGNGSDTGNTGNGDDTGTESPADNDTTATEEPGDNDTTATEEDDGGCTSTNPSAFAGALALLWFARRRP